MGNVCVRGDKLYLDYLGSDGNRIRQSSGYVVGQERQAREALRYLKDMVRAADGVAPDHKGPITVKLYAKKWNEERKALGVANHANEWATLMHHVFPSIGHLPIADVSASQVRDLIKGLRKAKTLAPKTIHNVYGVIRAMYREAVLAGHLAVSPCILKRPELGEAVDADAEWRPSAKFSREELITLISDGRIPR